MNAGYEDLTLLAAAGMNVPAPRNTGLIGQDELQDLADFTGLSESELCELSNAELQDWLADMNSAEFQFTGSF